MKSCHDISRRGTSTRDESRAWPPVNPLAWALALWVTVALVAVSGLGIYAALWWALRPDAPWSVRLIYRFGQTVLIWVVFVAAVGLATATVWGLRFAMLGR